MIDEKEGKYTCHLVNHPVYYRLYCAVAVYFILSLLLCIIVVVDHNNILCIIQRVFLLRTLTPNNTIHWNILLWKKKNTACYIYNIRIYMRNEDVATLSPKLQQSLQIWSYFTLFVRLYGQTIAVWYINNLIILYYSYDVYPLILGNSFVEKQSQTYNVFENIFTVLNVTNFLLLFNITTYIFNYSYSNLL